jgi:hypothetical protein
MRLWATALANSWDAQTGTPRPLRNITEPLLQTPDGCEALFFMSAGFAADVLTDGTLPAVACSGGGFIGGLVEPVSLAPPEVAGPGGTDGVLVATSAG